MNESTTSFLLFSFLLLATLCFFLFFRFVSFALCEGVGFESKGGRGGNENRKEIIKKKKCNATIIKKRPTQSGGRMERKKGGGKVVKRLC